ncbi:V-type ATP synthase subunit A [Candidatus Similichlamydia laticola]|uniref:V-type ATP synthase alpha chain n=1 Tax=Candidatus Similichlamydia laticola TaxID=2170265 RepID=A0A369KL30_9BACT|nr:V-type ATP synthase subunit A [Candidatus Similichlamydia laticola]RDB31716.1 V-type ATP synthase subunit A [Candidatus Similichlamydia laticola]
MQKGARGQVISAFGNLVEVEFEGSVHLGESASILVEGDKLRAEVLEIRGSMAKMQVFEPTYGLFSGAEVEFSRDLIEAELGPGLLGGVFDGLQNPLEEVFQEHGVFLARGVHFPPLARDKLWDFEPCVSVGAMLSPGSLLGTVQEGRFPHRIFVPFGLPCGHYQLEWLVKGGSYSVDTVLAHLKNAQGEIIEVKMFQKWPLKRPLLFGDRVLPFEPLETGCRVIDTQFPLLKGGAFCLPGPFGAGKTVLQHHLARYSSVDIVIFAACGERAGEIVELLKEFPHLKDPQTGNPLSDRTVLICNTSSMPVAARESSVYMAVTIGEYYRQMGLDVLMVADSTSRWAQAMREMSARLEEIPGDEAFPAYLNAKIAELYQRAGVVRLENDRFGSLCLGGAVSPAGGNLDEPVTQATLPVVGAFLGLSRARSSARRYPAIDPLISWSKYTEFVGDTLSKEIPLWKRWVYRAKALLEESDVITRRMDVLGEDGVALDEFISHLKAELYDAVYLQQNSFDPEDTYCPLKKQKVLFSFVNEVLDTDYSWISTHTEARSFFLSLQAEMRNLNFVKEESEESVSCRQRLRNLLEHASKQIGQGTEGGSGA